MSIRNVLRLGPGALAAALLAVPVRAADTEPGTWWEHTVQAEMGGMSMPATTQKFCAPKAGMNEPPSPAPDDRCKVTDVKKAGKKMTWKMECSGPEPMRGEGEIVQGKDSFTGKMSMHMQQGDMTMKMSGKLLGGDCDAKALEKKVAAIQKQQADQQQQADESMAQICDNAVDEMQLRLFSGPVTLCKDPAQAARACARMGTRDGYIAYRNMADQDPELSKVAKKLCKTDPDAARAKVCAQVATETRGDQTPDDVLEFLGNSCPDEARALAKKECAGRKFTGIPPGFRKVCVQYAREDLGGGKTERASEEPTPQEDPVKAGVKEKAMEKGKGVLRGLFK